MPSQSFIASVYVTSFNLCAYGRKWFGKMWSAIKLRHREVHTYCLLKTICCAMTKTMLNEARSTKTGLVFVKMYSSAHLQEDSLSFCLLLSLTLCFCLSFDLPCYLSNTQTNAYIIKNISICVHTFSSLQHKKNQFWI